jgi:hypothetical protein
MASLPMTPNTTCDLYHNGSPGPPANPDVAGVACFLVTGFRNIKVSTVYTHVFLIPLGTDVRDNYGNTATPGDTAYVPNKSGTPYAVTFIERVRTGGPYDHLRVYLNRIATSNFTGV